MTRRKMVPGGQGTGGSNMSRFRNQLDYDTQ